MSRSENKWRLLDTGLRRAAENMAMNRALLEGHQQGVTPHTLRFLQFTPCALLGFHQSAEQELKTDYCQANGIDIQRRMTGGGAIYFDQTQIGWELYLDKKVLGTADMGAIAKRICEAAARAISKLGVDAKFRPRNDIEVDGKKISGTGGAFDGDSILYQGTLLLDFDVGRMMRVLNIPAEKLSDKAIASAQERVANLKDLLGKLPDMASVKQTIAAEFAAEFGIEFEPSSELNADEVKLYNQALAEMDTADWVYQHNRPAAEAPTLSSIIKFDGGLVRTNVLLDASKNRIKQVWLTGDFFVKPRRLVADLEAALRDSAVVDLQRNVETFFASYGAEMLLLKPENFVTAIQAALDTVNQAESV
ncbi:MAG: lipoate--protein ligase [Gammaproteobacteria bacterium]|nr:lipoate--protein ligase [Gammaproteobacteria bacterium]